MQSSTELIRNSGILEIRNGLESISGGRVLDVGTQHGGFITTLMKYLKDYQAFVGIDISEKNLEKARECFLDDPVEFRLMNAENLSFDDDSFDTVCLSFSVHHLENVDDVLGEVIRVLKPGGYFILQEMFSDDDQSEAQLNESLAHHLGAKLDRMNGDPHFETYSRLQLKEFVDQLKLSTVEVYEASMSLKCIDCENLEECKNPTSDYSIKFGLSEIDDIIGRAEGHSSTEDVYQEAQLLRERVKSTGYRSASHLFFICEK